MRIFNSEIKRLSIIFADSLYSKCETSSYITSTPTTQENIDFLLNLIGYEYE